MRIISWKVRFDCSGADASDFLLNNAKSLPLTENNWFKSDIHESIRSFLQAYATCYKLMNSFQSIPKLRELTVHLNCI